MLKMPTPSCAVGLEEKISFESVFAHQISSQDQAAARHEVRTYMKAALSLASSCE